VTEEQVPDAWVGKEVLFHTQGSEGGISAKLIRLTSEGVVLSFEYYGGSELRDTIFFYPWSSIHRIQEPGE
jgi:hypothetical protein